MIYIHVPADLNLEDDHPTAVLPLCYRSDYGGAEEAFDLDAPRPRCRDSRCGGAGRNEL